MAQVGQGNNSRNMMQAKTPPHAPSSQGGTGTEGESSGVGSMYSAELVERVNKSVRNMGPSRPESAASGPVPTVTMASRRTGRTNR